MNTFKKKSLYAALAGASALGVTGAAQAVSVNPDGLGQVLIYPYYTIQDATAGNAYSSLLSVVNSTASVKAVKVRFLEGKNSQEVLDFNLFLSPRDVWTAAVLPIGVGAGVATFDKSCTVPVVSNNAQSPSPFVNYAYAGDLAGDGLERTKEGYVEIIEMGVPTDTTIITSVTHVNGVPPCTGLTTLTTSIAMAPPQGGLFGGMTLINVNAGTDYTEDPVALDNFRDSGRYDLPGSIKPDLRDVNPATAVINGGSIFGQGGVVFSGGWVQSIDAISALFMHDHVYNEFVLDAGTKSGTDWVVTMPTKRYYYTPVSTDTGYSYQVLYLFQKNFGADGACDDILFDLYDREEFRTTPQVGFSPPRPGAKPNTLCWEANVLSFNGTNVLGSKNNRNITTSFSNGWGDLQFPIVAGQGLFFPLAHVLYSFSTLETAVGGTTVLGTATYHGLPVIGFAVASFSNGTVTNAQGQAVLSNYGGNFVHKTKRTIDLGPLVGVAN